ANPFAGLVADKAGNMYGTTNSGGTCNNDDGFGTVYKLAPDGSETVLYAFKGGRDGSDPVGSLILGKNGRLYGASEFGGDMAGCGGGGCGTVFEVVPKGKESVLHAFESGGDGAEPVGGVIMDKAGNLYGTTSRGGGTGCSGDGCGTVFELAPDGTETILHAFQGGSDGELPQNGVVEDSAGNLYGTTGAGGTGAVGTVFEVTPDGAETVLYSFQPGPGGAIPTSVILDKAGNLYGTTYYGGSTGCKGAGCGVVYELAPDGTETVLNVFDKSRFGRVPSGGLLLGKHGDLYGTTGGGGDDDNGVVFELKN
ncbi:MAG: choice-of-anchor tandem repeat GloVer-containing protein, partial [Nitrososphaerales archaeon]